MDEFFNHPYFKDVDFEAMLEKKLKPPYMPKIDDNELKYFDPKLQAQSLDSEGYMNQLNQSREAETP